MSNIVPGGLVLPAGLAISPFNVVRDYTCSATVAVGDILQWDTAGTGVEPANGAAPPAFAGVAGLAGVSGDVIKVVVSGPFVVAKKTGTAAVRGGQMIMSGTDGLIAADATNITDVFGVCLVAAASGASTVSVEIRL